MENGVIEKNGIYWLDYRANGRRTRRKIGPSKKLAETIMRKIRVELAEGKYLDVSKATKVKFKDLAHVYMENHAKPNKRSWYSCDFKYLKNLIPVFGEQTLAAITPLMIDKYKSDRRERDGVSVATVNRELSLLRCMFNKAIDWDMAVHNPLRKVEFYKENNCRLRYLELEEIKRLIEVCSPQLRSIVTLALNTGMRKSEIQFLKWEDVNFTRGYIELKQTKNGEKRIIPMNRAIYNALASVNRHTSSPYVFANEEGNPYNSRKSFETALKKSGIIAFRFHDLRHTFASHLTMAGVELNTVRELLGHKSLNMTLRYAHLSPDHKSHAVELLDSKMDSFWTPGALEVQRPRIAEAVTYYLN